MESGARRRGPCPLSTVLSTGHVKLSDKIIPVAIALELRDQVVGSGPAQQVMLSEGSDPKIRPIKTFELNLKKNFAKQVGGTQRVTSLKVPLQSLKDAFLRRVGPLSDRVGHHN